MIFNKRSKLKQNIGNEENKDTLVQENKKRILSIKRTRYCLSLPISFSPKSDLNKGDGEYHVVNLEFKEDISVTKPPSFGSSTKHKPRFSNMVPDKYAGKLFSFTGNKQLYHNQVGLKTLQYKAVEKLLENNRDYDVQYIYGDIAQKRTKLKRDVIKITHDDIITDFPVMAAQLDIKILHDKRLNNVYSIFHGSFAWTAQNNIFDVTTDVKGINRLTLVSPMQFNASSSFARYLVATNIFMHLVYDNRTMSEGHEEEISNDASDKSFHFDDVYMSFYGVGSINRLNLKHIFYADQCTIYDPIEDYRIRMPEFQYFEKADTKDGKALADKDEKIKERNQRHKSTEASEGSANQPIHHTDICSDDHCTTFNSQEDNSTGMPVSMINENLSNIQDNQILSSEVNTDISSDESWSTVESTLIRLYENVIRNETSRMMSSIGIEAEHLFGLERSQIFFDLLDEELCHFGLAGALIDSVPNMAESTVRQNVISFFEHAVNRLMTVLLTCPDSKLLQQMPVQNFISLMKSVIKSSLIAQTKGREKYIYTMVDPKDFERALGEEIPEDVLNRLRNEDEMVVHRFVDTRLERHQPSDREENRPIYSIYFPSDCRLFIYIPTADRSYWHHLDMRRANRIRQRG